MSEADEELDESLRLRTRRLAISEPLPLLDPDARERVVSAAWARAEQERRFRRRRAWAVGVGGVLLAAAAAAVLGWRFSAPSRPVAADRRSHAPIEIARASGGDDPARDDRAAPRRCEGFAAAADVALAPSGAWRRADLSRALVVSGATDDAVIREASPCRTVIDLRSGTVAVHARDLGGGELRVHTDLGDVVVHGTAFSARRDATGLAVEVVEGTVGVELRARPGTQAREIAVSMDHRFTTQSAEVVGLAPAARAGLRVLLGLDAPVGAERTAALDPRGTDAEPTAARTSPERTSPARPSSAASTNVVDGARAAESTIGPSESLGADALVRMAEAARRAGDLATARRLYREAGARSGATAEAAWLSLARLELRAGSPAQATRAIEEHRRRFGSGRLGAEAAWIGVRAARASGDEARARRTAEDLVRRFPASPQATAARQLLQ